MEPETLSATWEALVKTIDHLSYNASLQHKCLKLKGKIFGLKMSSFLL